MINKEEFFTNLDLTQKYCIEKLNDKTKNLASILRTINPKIKGKKIFTFELNHFDYEFVKEILLSKWTTDANEYDGLIPELFNKQLDFKKSSLIENNIPEIEGKILVTEFGCSVTDGVSEIESKGIIDFFDLPPIDTWFYIDIESGLLFSWIPSSLKRLVDEAIAVNCVDMMEWMDTEKHIKLHVEMFGVDLINNDKKLLKAFKKLNLSEFLRKIK